MIKNSQGILICENCGEKIRTDLKGDRICPLINEIGDCPDLGLIYTKPEKSKTTRTGKETKNYDHK
jgi:hypothetical protein